MNKELEKGCQFKVLSRNLLGMTKENHNTFTSLKIERECFSKSLVSSPEQRSRHLLHRQKLKSLTIHDGSGGGNEITVSQPPNFPVQL